MSHQANQPFGPRGPGPPTGSQASIMMMQQPHYSFPVASTSRNRRRKAGDTTDEGSNKRAKYYEGIPSDKFSSLPGLCFELEELSKSHLYRHASEITKETKGGYLHVRMKRDSRSTVHFAHVHLLICSREGCISRKHWTGSTSGCPWSLPL